MPGWRPATRRRARPSRPSSRARNTRSRSWWWRRADRREDEVGAAGGSGAMASISTRRVWLVAAMLCGLGLLVEPAIAQPAPAPPAPSTTDADRNSPAYTASVDSHIAVRPDLTAAIDTTVRYKILRESAI